LSHLREQKALLGPQVALALGRQHACCHGAQGSGSQIGQLHGNVGILRAGFANLVRVGRMAVITAPSDDAEDMELPQVPLGARGQVRRKGGPEGQGQGHGHGELGWA